MDATGLKDYYKLLEIPPDSTVNDIHKAYWHKASRSHPDMGGSHEEMLQVVEAWKILSDPNKRARYDQLRKYRHDGWRSKKFNADVQEARKRAKEYSARSWAEFEEIYQKAFYIFNQDFYGEDISGAGKAAGPHSPLMGLKSQGGQVQDTAISHPSGSATNRVGARIVNYIIKAVILIAAIVTVLIFTRSYCGTGRYVSLGQQDATSVLMLDTTTGAVYSVDNRVGHLSSPWKIVVPPVTER